MTSTIAFVGAGPTAIYTMCAFVTAARRNATIVIYEGQSRAGLGTPYRPGWNDPAMLSNIASIEIPKIEDTLIGWLEGQPRARLVRLGIDPDDIDERAFYPRVALGEYFLDQFTALIEHARDKGINVEIATNCRVTDIIAEDRKLRLQVTPRAGKPFERAFDQVVLATGHEWPEEPEARPGYFVSPWPASALQRVEATSIVIRGSSLTAIDAVVALSTANGVFIEGDGDAVDYRVHPGAEALKLTMMSRKGLLPEADFYHPIPYETLTICTPEAITALIQSGDASLLDKAFELFRQELTQADPDYADKVSLSSLSLEDFADSYFNDRLAADRFEWAEDNLREARDNVARQFTVPWRYAILRMHEVIGLLTPHLDETSLERFNRHLKPVFVDEYATVPHLSIERLLALHRAGRLEILPLSDNYRVDTHSEQTGATILVNGKRRHFPVFVDATGQRPLAADDFPFKSLLRDGVVVSASDDPSGVVRGIAVKDDFHPLSDHPAANRLFVLSIPFLLGRHPFIQGITSAKELGDIVGASLAGFAGHSPCADGTYEVAA